MSQASAQTKDWPREKLLTSVDGRYRRGTGLVTSVRLNPCGDEGTRVTIMSQASAQTKGWPREKLLTSVDVRYRRGTGSIKLKCEIGKQLSVKHFPQKWCIEMRPNRLCLLQMNQQRSPLTDRRIVRWGEKQDSPAARQLL